MTQREMKLTMAFLLILVVLLSAYALDTNAKRNIIESLQETTQKGDDCLDKRVGRQMLIDELRWKVEACEADLEDWKITASAHYSQVEGCWSDLNECRSDLDAYIEPIDDLEIECSTPMSLMLHSAFGVDRMENLATEIIQRGLITTTYRQVLRDIIQGQCPDKNMIIISLDDFRTDRESQKLKDIIQVFTDKGLVLVLGVIVQGPQSPEIWEYLRDLDRFGIEIASHTINHPNLPWLDRDKIYEEVVGSYRIICAQLGQCPTSLILPNGNNDPDGIIFSIAQDYAFVIGIARGTSFINTLPAYLGRIGPYNESQDVTIQRLEIIFKAGRE